MCDLHQAPRPAECEDCALDDDAAIERARDAAESLRIDEHLDRERERRHGLIPQRSDTDY